MSNPTGDALREHGPYRVKWIGPGVWAGITDELPASLEGRDVWVTTSPLPAAFPADAGLVTVDVQRMETSRGPDFFVRIKRGERSVTPYVFRERFKAEYEVAHFQWVFGLRDKKPELMSYDETTYPNDALARASSRDGGRNG